MSDVILVKDKWETKVYAADDLDAAALKILRERVEDGFWYDGEARTRAEGILADNNGLLAWRFLRQRSQEGYEYETVSLEQTR